MRAPIICAEPFCPFRAIAPCSTRARRFGSSMKRLLLLAMAGSVLGCLMAAVALAGGSPQIEYTAAGQAAARAAVVHQSDLSAGWRGYYQRPSSAELHPNNCEGFSPDRSDLVVEGAETSTWTNGKFPLSAISSKAIVFKTPAMARLDWQRTQQPHAAVACDASAFAAGLAATFPGKLVSYTKVSFPQVAPRTTAIRFVYELKSKPVVSLVCYAVYGDVGRTEIWLADAQVEGSPKIADLPRLARLLVERIHS
jgi:hypothetical protein